MTRVLYVIFIRIFIIGIHIDALFNKKSKLAVRGRKNPIILPPKVKKRLWIHCASLGEYEQARPIIEQLGSAGMEVVLSFFSPSGYEPKKNDTTADYVVYMPFDTSKNARRFLKAVDPDLIIFIKYEFWWNFIRIILASKTPLIFVSVALREQHYLFRKLALPFLNLLSQCDQLFLIDTTSYELLAQKGFENITLAGDTRVESIYNQKMLGIDNKIFEAFSKDSEVLFLGSSYPIEHEEIVRIFDNITEYQKIIIFPHNIDQKEIYELKDQLGKQCAIYSIIKALPVFSGYDILIVDEIGLLKDAYKYASMVYIGGGFTHGLHNILEPFVYKLPIIFGPKYEKFPEAKYLSEQKFVKVIHHIHELEEAVTALREGDFDLEIEKIYSVIFEENGSASTNIIRYVKNEI